MDLYSNHSQGRPPLIPSLRNRGENEKYLLWSSKFEREKNQSLCVTDQHGSSSATKVHSLWVVNKVSNYLMQVMILAMTFAMHFHTFPSRHDTCACLCNDSWTSIGPEFY